MKQPLPRRVYSILRSKLLEGELTPGTRLDYQFLAKELEVSTTPVREAVMQLASEGYVELIPRLGAVVRSLNETSAREFYEVREAVETFAALKAAERMSAGSLENLRRKLATMRELYQGVLDREGHNLDPAGLRVFLDADLAFHKIILHGAKNNALARTVEESHIQSRIFFADRGVHDLIRLRKACEQHAAILDALDRRDGPAAAEAMRIHIDSSYRFTLEHLDSNSVDQRAWI